MQSSPSGPLDAPSNAGVIYLKLSEICLKPDWVLLPMSLTWLLRSTHWRAGAGTSKPSTVSGSRRKSRGSIEIDAELGQRRQARFARGLAFEDLEARRHRGAQQRRHRQPRLDRGIDGLEPAHLADRAPVTPQAAQRLDGNGP